ncbi:hypothetical protein FHX44_115982 [Pseudonocardia hierapolitana]|uniref:Uncharacterized protein n=1 Tax=Pseudonocardia hierapolitana TaxID=1128676 RepID=A0A561SYT8_9PSEU|nr:hypothetical protein [Pseudonocardia hierapolitana]TWF80045.1 hypothetical protein FHX44_115982 [Pseudonocardia hierapolitana]
MGPDDRERIALDAMIQEARELGKALPAFLLSFERIFSLSIVVLIGSLTLGLDPSRHVILVVLPFPLLVFYAFALQAFTEMLSRAGHKRYLEETINERLGEQVLLDEIYVASVRQSRLSHGLMYLSIATFLGLLAIVGFVVSLRQAAFVPYLYVIGIVLLASLNVSAYIELRAAYKKGYEIARRATRTGSSGPLPPPESPLLHSWSIARP